MGDVARLADVPYVAYQFNARSMARAPDFTSLVNPSKVAQPANAKNMPSTMFRMIIPFVLLSAPAPVRRQ